MLILTVITNDETMYARWKLYQNRFFYAKDIEFKDVIQAIKKLKIFSNV